MTTVNEPRYSRKEMLALIATAPVSYDLETASIWNACLWYESMAQKSRLPAKRVNAVLTAVRSLLARIDPDTKPTVKWLTVPENLAILATNYLNSGSSPASTPNNYAKKVRDLCQEYSDRCIQDAAWKPPQSWAVHWENERKANLRAITKKAQAPAAEAKAQAQEEQATAAAAFAVEADTEAKIRADVDAIVDAMDAASVQPVPEEPPLSGSQCLRT